MGVRWGEEGEGGRLGIIQGSRDHSEVPTHPLADTLVDGLIAGDNHRDDARDEGHGSSELRWEKRGETGRSG